MDFSDRLRAARALLNLRQEDLAEAAGVAAATVGRIESGDASINERTQTKLLRALGKHGISFTAKGIEKDEFPIYFTSGKTHEEAYLALLADAFEHLRTVRNPELLIMYADDSVSPSSVNDTYREMRAEGVKMRQLIQEGNTYIIGPLNEYRYIPKHLFINRVTLVYGDRIANETGDVHHGIIRVDPLNARMQRNNFDILWSTLTQPTETIADERF